MRCPNCGERFDVKESREVRVDGCFTTRRRRQCSACGHRVQTVEVVEGSTNLSQRTKSALAATSKAISALTELKTSLSREEKKS